MLPPPNGIDRALLGGPLAVPEGPGELKRSCPSPPARRSIAAAAAAALAALLGLRPSCEAR